jgi:hypothetical protein
MTNGNQPTMDQVVRQVVAILCEDGRTTAATVLNITWSRELASRSSGSDEGLRERVEALAKEWEGMAGPERAGGALTYLRGRADAARLCAGILRRALSSGSPAPEARVGPVLAAEINALPERVWAYIHDLEARADPAGEVQELACARENVAALTVSLSGAQKALAAARRVRDMADQKDDFWIVDDPVFQGLACALDDLGAAPAPEDGESVREALAEAERLLFDVSPHGCGGYGDFPPEGGWDAWEDRYEAWHRTYRAVSVPGDAKGGGTP